MTKTEQQLKDLLEPAVIELGYKLYDVMYLKESSEWFLRLFIEKENGKIDLDDCEKVSEKISEILDEKDPISESYNLEVSSCGLERHLREDEHFKAAIGKNITIKLFKPLDGLKEFTGELKNYLDNNLTIFTNELQKEIVIKKEDISMSKILFNWEDLKNE